ncbi:hypothetical protein LN042_11510 [Kitasatospora sp. RB6PN24]|uniref:hypothetical protein n=1 Tax=Kitasatospora humi TaxID=2893891 RepID=UPI001E4823BD|nr:hypothetical protein [Kitasatospora humi]MCC9307716.1 hypothetical protein [Kitasatospora humi]
MTPVNRAFCPLNCGWHNDWPTDEEPTHLGPALLPGLTTEERALIHLKDSLARAEAIIREHLETHTLLEWVQAVTSLSAAVQRGLHLADLLEDEAYRGYYLATGDAAQRIREALNQQPTT